MSQPRSLFGRFTLFNFAAFTTIDVGYGAIGATHSIAELTHHSLPLSGMENSFFHAFPYTMGYGCVVGSLSFLELLIRDLQTGNKEGKTERCLYYMSTLAANVLTLAACIYEGKSQVMGTGLAAFQLTCDTLVLGSLVQLLFMCKRYCDSYHTHSNKDRERMRSEIIYEIVSTLAWSAFALSHVAGLAVAAPLLVAVGYVLLGAAAIAHLKNVYDVVYPSAPADERRPSLT